jgi:GNAT superfamily N-acetyltransferase
MAAITLRVAVAEDVGILLGLVRELALYEKMPDAVVATEADLLRHGFGSERRFEALLALVDGQPAGFALFYPNFSTWQGRPGLFLEDLFVAEWARQHGVGRRLMTRLAALALERGWARFDLSVLHWNPARQFYHRIGMRHLEEWLPYRIDGAALRALAAEEPGDC